MLKNDYEVEILVNGHKVDEYLKDGKVFIEARKNTKYSIKIKNNSWKKILAILTVDGLSVVDGKEASFDSPGYVIYPHHSSTIDGWRKSDSEVAEFYFSDLEKSYAAKIDKNGNQGIIGVAIYQEKEPQVVLTTYTYTETPQWPYQNTKYFGTCTSAYSSQVKSRNLGASSMNYCSSSIQDYGTGWGEVKKSEVINTSFESDKSTLTILEILYNSRKELEKMGIQFEKKVNYVSFSKAFPNEYCQEPKK
jgi:hypothetical protein